MEQGRETEQEARSNREHKREDEDGRIERHRGRAWNAARVRGDERVQSQVGEGQAGRSASHGEDEALGDKLPHQPGTTGA